MPPHLALATNKGQSVFGAAAALARFSHAGMVPLRRARWTAPLGFLGALVGARLVLAVRPEVLRPVVLALLVGAAVLLLLRPRVAGGRTASAAVAPAAALAFAVGVYDGFFGPGTGTLLIVSLAGVLAVPLHQASAEAKAINFASNLSAMLLFATEGAVVWHTALWMAAGQLVGGWLGAHLTVRGGDRVVRWVVLAVVAALVFKLSLDALRG